MYFYGSGRSIGAFLAPVRKTSYASSARIGLSFAHPEIGTTIFAPAGLAGNTKNRAARKKTRGFFSPRAKKTPAQTPRRNAGGRRPRRALPSAAGGNKERKRPESGGERGGFGDGQN